MIGGLLACTASIAGQPPGDFLVATPNGANTDVLAFQPAAVWAWNIIPWWTNIPGAPLALEQDTQNGVVYLLSQTPTGTVVYDLLAPYQTGCAASSFPPRIVVSTPNTQPIRDIWTAIDSATGTTQLYYTGWDSVAGVGFVGRISFGGTGIARTNIAGMGDPAAITVDYSTGGVWVATQTSASQPARLHAFAIGAGPSFVPVAGYPIALANYTRVHDLAIHPHPSQADPLVISFSIGQIHFLRRMSFAGTLGYAHDVGGSAVTSPATISVNELGSVDFYALHRGPGATTNLRYYYGQNATPRYRAIPGGPNNAVAICWISRVSQAETFGLTSLGRANALGAPYTNIGATNLTFSLSGPGSTPLSFMLGTTNGCVPVNIGGADFIIGGTVQTFAVGVPNITLPFPNLNSMNGVDLHAQWYGIDAGGALSTSSCMSTRFGLARGN